MSIIKKKNNNNKYIVIVAIVAIAMLATLCVIISLIIPKQNNKESKSGSSQTTSSNNTSETISPEDEIKSLSESNRMKRYIGIFFENIEQENYQEAYNKLNEDYKSNYFSTLQEFTDYAKENFKKATVKYTPLLSYSELLKKETESGHITSDQYDILKNWHEDPWAWDKKFNN